jgi:hypothetical protein
VQDLDEEDEQGNRGCEGNEHASCNLPSEEVTLL